MIRIALFGTSADPPTTGHLAVMRWLTEQFDQVAVWASDNPFKAHPASLAHRTAMLRLLISELQLPDKIQVYPDLSYPRTIITVEQAQKRWVGAEFTLVVGADLARQLPRWWRITELLQQVKLLVIPRSGYTVAAEDLTRLQDLGAMVTIADLTPPAVSSTQYREQGSTDSITPLVQAYIDREQLYGCHARQEKLPMH
jgi:nicotinate-nucleotide adenylyltransferase